MRYRYYNWQSKAIDDDDDDYKEEKEEKDEDSSSKSSFNNINNNNNDNGSRNNSTNTNSNNNEKINNIDGKMSSVKTDDSFPSLYFFRTNNASLSLHFYYFEREEKNR